MLVSKNVIWQIKRYKMNNVYISSSELDDLLNNLTPTEIRLYNHVKSGALQNVDTTFFSSKSLAQSLGTTPKTIDNLKALLKKKGYLVIDRFKDNRGELMVRAVIGKDQVVLYNLGLNMEITNAKAYSKLLKLFPIDDTNLTQDAREELVVKLNEYYEVNKQDFN